jgi:hypothetical protein
LQGVSSTLKIDDGEDRVDHDARGVRGDHSFKRTELHQRRVHDNMAAACDADRPLRSSFLFIYCNFFRCWW